MLLHHSPFLRIYFGDARDRLRNIEYLNLPPGPILEVEPFCQLKKLMKVDQLMFLSQKHTNVGVTLADNAAVAQLVPFEHEGDYLITKLPHVGIGVVTADCLPIVIHDTFNNVVAIIHAGWKGAVANIGPIVLNRMQQLYGTDFNDITIFFGPSAKACCYEVKEDFLGNLEAFPFVQEVLQRYGDQIMFDLPGFNRIILENMGVPKDAFHFDYNRCTMCDFSFYSNRRTGVLFRQMTVVSLT